MPARNRLSEHPYLSLPRQESVGVFHFNRKPIRFMEGDTVASALFASGITIFSRSFKYHRARGLYDNQGYGAETLVTVDGAPNLLADRVLVQEGLQVETQNAWPSVEFDLMAINDSLVPLLPNGFYYKMFHKPKWAWPFFEPMIRKAAGLGKIDVHGREVNKRYEKRYRFPDLCVVGAGPAGLSAALAGAREGKDVLLIERDPQLGGHARYNVSIVEGCADESLNGRTEQKAVTKLIDQVEQEGKIEVLAGTLAFGVYEDNLVAAENGSDLFKIRASAVVVAGGANDRHLVFENNDLPGIMTGRGVERVIGLHGVVPGRRAVIVTTHDGGYHCAYLLKGAGVEIAAVVDARENPSGYFAERVNALGVTILRGQTVHAALGSKRVSSVRIGPLLRQGFGAAPPLDGQASQTLPCDLLVLAVGLTPQLGLLAMGRNRPRWDEERAVFRVSDPPDGLYAAGEVNGHAGFTRLIQEGTDIGKAAAHRAPVRESKREPNECIQALPPDIDCGGNKHFICKCMDVTRKETQASIAEGYDQIETLKRFTSMGMGHCQGKTCYEAAARLAVLDSSEKNSDGVPTTMRPPLVPVSFGVLAGRAPHLVPVRRTAMHDRHEKLGAKFLLAGLWKRPETYTSTEDEAVAVREGLAIIDVGTLGKLEVSGPDVQKFLHFMMPGKYAKLKVGRVRYHTMVGEDGILTEDGTISHVAEGRYFISTTTGNAEAIHNNFRWWITTDGFDVHVKDLGASLAAVNVTGPEAREMMQPLVDIDLSNEAFSYMACGLTHIEEVPVYLFRIGFTGELSYEVHYPAEYGEAMWDFLLEKGRSFGMKPFGVETQRVLRLEKGHILPGVDTDALTTPYQAGVGFTVKDDKPDFIGKSFLAHFKERGIEEQLISYKLAPGVPVPDDGVVILDRGDIIGRVTSSRMSPVLGHGIGLGWVKAPYAKPGTKVSIRLASGQDVIGEILDGFAAYDPQGEKLRS